MNYVQIYVQIHINEDKVYSIVFRVKANEEVVNYLARETLKRKCVASYIKQQQMKR